MDMQSSPPPRARKTTQLFLLAVALALFVGGCATAPSKGTANEALSVAAGYQRLHITAVAWVGSAQAFPGSREQARPEERAGATCTARNAKGSWVTTTPGTVDVATGAGPLTIECAMAGFRTAHVEFSCVTPHARSAVSGGMAGLNLIGAMGPAAIYAAPAVILAVLVGAVSTGAAVGSATAGPDADVCNYSERGFITMGLQPEEKR